MRTYARWLVIAVCAGTAVAQPSVASPARDEIIIERRTEMEALSAAMQALGQQIMSGNPDRAAVVEQANRIGTLATALPGWFPAGTGTDHGDDTAALPAIWETPDDFAAKAADLKTAAADLSDLAATGDLRQLMNKAMAVDRSCVACHKLYQKRD